LTHHSYHKEDTMRQPALDPSMLETLIAALPNAVLRPLLLSLLGVAPAATAATATPASAPKSPARKRRGWIKGRPRKAPPREADRLVNAMAAAEAKRAADQRREKEAAARKAKRAAKAGNGDGGKAGNGSSEPTPAQRLWQRAEAMQPRAPWRAVRDAFNVNEALAHDCFKTRTVPPGIAHGAIERFLDIPAT
jgi:hypothetical protein